VFAVAVAAFSLLAYAYIGYPLLIILLGKFFPSRIREDPDYLPKVSVCIPIYNAASHVEAKVASLRALDYPPDKLEFLLFSDGSTDRTPEIAESLAAGDERVKLFRQEARRGKPTALNQMRESATGEVLLMTDIRQPLAPGALRALVRKLADPDVGCVSGNLVLRGGTGAGVYWRYENRIREAEGAFRSMVGVTGPVYAMRKKDLAPLPPDVILDDMLVPMRLRLAGRRNVFAPDAVAWDDAFGDEREFGRKARTLAGNYQLFALLPGLFLPHGSWFEIMSHKILRLLCPWLLALLFISSTVGALSPHAWPIQAMAGAQLIFYAIAALGPRAGKLGTVARTFVVMNWAAVVGLWRFLTGSQRITW
jgi:cellulose synthase/poly-beta-1,6-N-acetylglucosamine synthase-like glycosyltransferase